MKFLILNTDYSDFLYWLYSEHAGLEKQSYEEQRRVRMESLFGTADFYSSNLCRLGHEAWDIIANIEPMQKQWAKEHGIPVDRVCWRLRLRRGVVPWLYRQREWLYSILAAQIRAYRPDVLFSMAIETIGSDFLDSVKDYYRLAIVQHAAPLPTHDYSRYDLALSSLPNQVDYFRQQGMESELFRLGFEPKILGNLYMDKKRYDITFVGGLGNYHQAGTQILAELCTQHCVAVWGYDTGAIPADSPIHGCYRGSLWGTDMYQALHDSRIVFNRHINIAENYANNMRLYETTGVGACLLTDHKCNLADMFEPGREVVVYHDANECTELARYYLEHDEEREAIARAGQQRTLQEHTYYYRMQELVEIVCKYL